MMSALNYVQNLCRNWGASVPVHYNLVCNKCKFTILFSKTTLLPLKNINVLFFEFGRGNFCEYFEHKERKEMNDTPIKLANMQIAGLQS